MGLTDNRNMPNKHYSPDQVLPQRAPMLLIDQITAWSNEWIEVIVNHQNPTLFSQANGNTPAWVALEYICQAAAAHAGILQLESGQNIKLALVLGTRKLDIAQTHFKPQERLLIRAQMDMVSTEGIGVYKCDIYTLEPTKKLLSSCSIKAIMLDDPTSIVTLGGQQL